MKKEEELIIDDLIEGEIYVAEGKSTYLFRCTDTNKKINHYIILEQKKTHISGDVNIKTNSFSQKYRRATYREKQIWELSVERGQYTEPIKTPIYEIY